MAQKRSRATFEADQQAQQSPYVLYGTPLPPQDPDVRDDGSYVPAWQQEVFDDQGRKRLHGAFTGGFSAGYFNTVGSKEGWTPSTFVSSRSTRNKDAKPKQQRAEDFMDEEDLADAEEARKVQTTDAFAGIGAQTRPEGTGDPMMDVFKMEGENTGVKLLKKMGWREGQGVGPRIKRKARLSEQNGSGGNEAGDEHLFAPEDSRMIAFIRKNDQKGLGFEGEGRLGEAAAPYKAQERAETKVLDGVKSKTKKRTIVPRTSFGVGILNDTGSDDEDPYSMGPQVIYKSTLGPEKKTKKKLLQNGPTGANPMLGSKPQFISKKKISKNPAALRRCHDGRLPISGFVLSSLDEAFSSITSSHQKYPPVQVPEGWKSSKVPSTEPTAEGYQAYQSTADVARTANLSPKSRARLLGEAQLPGKSVFDFLSTNARDRIANATNKPNLPTAKNEAAELSAPGSNSLSFLIPYLDPTTAQTALARASSGWMPYAEDPGKRLRYRSFLEYSADPQKRTGLPERAPKASKDDYVKELQEFAHAAQIFKPVTGLMASRFTTSSSAAPALGSDHPDRESKPDIDANDPLIIKPKPPPSDPALEAARMGMYGHLTRETKTFYPTRLLCKRFNVLAPAHADPGAAPDDPSSSTDEKRSGFSERYPQKQLDLVGKRDMQELMAGFQGGGGGRDGFVSGGFEGSKGEETPGDMGSDEKKVEELYPSREKEVTIDPERNEALEKERPSEDLFKAIFGSDDESDRDG